MAEVRWPVPGEAFASTYTISPHDPEDEMWMIQQVTVEWTGRARWLGLEGDDDVWAIRAPFSKCFSRMATWDWEPSPSNRDEEWIQGHRFNLANALPLAKLAMIRIMAEADKQ